MNFNLNLDINDIKNIDQKKIQKLIIISNALDDNWHIRKQDNNYIFSKKINGVKEIYSENFLNDFVSKYSQI
jgi:hypothetical protein